MGVTRKLGENDVARFRPDHVGGVDAVDRNDAPCNGDRHQVFDSDTLDTQLYFTAARAPKPFHHFVLPHLHARYYRVVDRDDAVSAQHADLRTRTRIDDVEHDDRIGGHVEHHADPVEFSVERFVHLCHILGRDINRMRVEFFQDERNCLLGDRIHRDGVYVAVLDQGKEHVEFAAARSDQITAARHRRCIFEYDASQQDPDSDGDCHDGRQDQGEFIVFIHVVAILRFREREGIPKNISLSVKRPGSAV